MHNPRYPKIAGNEGFMYYFDDYMALTLQERSDMLEIVHTDREI